MKRGAYTRWRSLASLGAMGLLGVILAGPGLARAEDKSPTRTIGVAVQQGRLLVSCDYRDVFARRVQTKLTSGLPTRIVLQMELVRRGGKPVAGWARSAEVVYDLWEERYQVTLEDDRGRRRTVLARAEDAMAAAGKLAGDDVATVTDLPAGDYRLHVVVEVNPVSRHMVERIRRWLARPPAGKASEAGQGNFFGSFVGTFVDRRIGEADHTVEFFSQWFHLGQP